MTLQQSNEFINHPQYRQLLAFGYGNAEENLTTLAVYLDLIENKGWYNVEMHPVDGLRRTVVAGHSGQTDERQIVLASNLEATLSMEQIISTLSIIEQNFHTNNVLIGFVDADSTIVYYSLTSGLVPPPPVDVLKSKKLRQRSKNRRRMPMLVTFERPSALSAILDRAMSATTQRERTCTTNQDGDCVLN